MSERHQRESFDRRQAEQRYLTMKGARRHLDNALQHAQRALNDGSGEWSQDDRIRFGDIEDWLTELLDSADALIKQYDELSSESPIISERDI